MPAVIDEKKIQNAPAWGGRAVALLSTTLVVGFADETVLNLRPNHAW